MPEAMGIFTDLTVRENIVLAARSGPVDKNRLDWILGLFPALKRFWNLPAGNLSGGQKQMLAIARAIAELAACCSSTSRPRVWLPSWCAA